jgi:tetratricopeptide (TPR) repeat protein
VEEALEHYREAESVLRTAEASWPMRPTVLHTIMQTGYDLGTTFDKLNRHEQSLAAFTRALEAGRRLIAIEDRDQALLRNMRSCGRRSRKCWQTPAGTQRLPRAGSGG